MTTRTYKTTVIETVGDTKREEIIEEYEFDDVDAMIAYDEYCKNSMFEMLEAQQEFTDEVNGYLRDDEIKH